MIIVTYLTGIFLQRFCKNMGTKKINKNVQKKNKKKSTQKVMRPNTEYLRKLLSSRN